MQKKLAIGILLLFFAGGLFAQSTSNKINLSSNKNKSNKINLSQPKQDAKEAEKPVSNPISISGIDNTGPEITILSPVLTRGFIKVPKEKYLTLVGQVKDQSGVFELIINDSEVPINADGVFTHKLPLAFGDNTITIKATDVKKNVAVKEVIANREAIIQQEIVAEKKNENKLNKKGKYFALIIGVQDYRDPKIVDLDQPVKDAQKLKNVLVDRYTFEEENVKFLENPSLKEVTLSLEYYFKNITENDNLLIFYAGHGYWDPRFEQGYWLTSDAEKENRSTWFSNSMLRDYIRAIPAKHSLLITDACFGGGIFKSRDAFGNASMAIEQLYKLPSRKAMTSGALSEVPDKSVFIEYLVKRLDQNEEKFITAEQLFASFKIAVINNSANNQVPQFGEVKQTGDEGGDFIFIKK